MIRTSKEIESIVLKIRDLQSYVILNRYFIRDIEAAGGDTTNLKKEIEELEARIKELQLRCGDYY